jgi:gamma-glutamyltranspeptidase / glutathione hydrolase
MGSHCPHRGSSPILLGMSRRFCVAIVCLAPLIALRVVAADPLVRAPADVAGRLVRCRNAAVVSVNRLASEIGLHILKRGGSAVDAAVASAFALAVTYPAAGNIGGGGYMLVVPSDQRAQTIVVDFRETAPASAARDMFVEKPARTPHRRVGIPGTVRGLALAHQRFGRLNWRELVTPAVELAREGFALDSAVATDLNKTLALCEKSQFSAFHRTYGRTDGQPWHAGDRLVLAELADVLARIADQGPDGFYTGTLAELIAAEMRRGDGLITTADLADYRPVVREPIRASYRHCEILAVGPSSSGGITLVEALNILETFDLRSRGRWSADTLHLMIESMKRSYRDRACYLGDPGTAVIPEKLLDKQYARQLAANINPRRAIPSEELAGEIPIARESEQTTHLSVVDREGNAVSLTYTLESAFGSRVVVAGGGFLLNDEMNDFNWLPGVTDRSGRVGTVPNQIAPGKRMLSSMCPIVVRRDGRLLLVTGSPGGRTIINTVLCMVVNVVDFDMDIRQAVDAPRLHHQWLPDRVRVEPALVEQHPLAIKALRELGHVFADRPLRQGDAHTIWMDSKSGEIVGAADDRVTGSAVGY